MELNYKIINILNLLLSSDGRVSLQELMQRGKITKRTLYYNLDKLNHWLKQRQLSALSIEDGYLILQKGEMEVIRQELASYDEMHYVFSLNERKALIYIMIALSTEPVTIEQLGTALNISRNTVVADIAELKKEMTVKHITLLNRHKQGYILEGDETEIRYLLMEYMYSVDVENAHTIAMDVLYSAVSVLTKNTIDIAIMGRISNIVENAEQHISGKFNNYTLTEMAVYILVIYVRSIKSPYVTHDFINYENPEYMAAKIIVEDLKGIDIVIAKQEIQYIAAVLLGSKLYDFNTDADVQNNILSLLTWDIIDTFEAKACVVFSDKEELYSRLILHIKPMYYRLKFKIKVKNLFADEIFIKYRDIYNLTDLTMKTIQGKYELVIPDEEIAYICIYLGGWLRKSVMDLTERMSKILIVCNHGVGTSLLLKTQLGKLLGDGYQYDIKDERQFSPEDFSNYSLIVTSVQTENASANMIQVSPLITDSQKKKILDWIIDNKQLVKEEGLGQILEVVRKHTLINNESALVTELFQVVQGGTLPDNQRKQRLLQILTPSHVRIVEEEVKETEAIALACESLKEEGIIEDGYAASILDIIDKMGLYTELAPGIMLAHGKPDKIVNRIGISLTLFLVPVEFAKWKKQIRVIFTLAAIDNESHFYVLKDLLALLKKEENYQKLIHDNFTVNELYQFITEAMEEIND